MADRLKAALFQAWVWPFSRDKPDQMTEAKWDPFHYETGRGVNISPDLVDWQPCGRLFSPWILPVEYHFPLST